MGIVVDMKGRRVAGSDPPAELSPRDELILAYVTDFQATMLNESTAIFTSTTFLAILDHIFRQAVEMIDDVYGDGLLESSSGSAGSQSDFLANQLALVRQCAQEHARNCISALEPINSQPSWWRRILS